MKKKKVERGGEFSLKQLKGVKVPHRKNTTHDKPVRMPIPAKVRIPMAMHIGAPCKPVVAVGDEVTVGQIIGEPQGFVGAPIHASVSGKVTAIDKVQLFNGSFFAVVIEADGQQTICADIKPPQITDTKSFLDAVRASGLVGLGGAGFPTSVKLTLKEPGAAEYLVINGAECEPYLTSDFTTMTEDTDYMIKGIEYVRKYVGVKHIVLGIENNKPEAISLFQSKASSIGSDFSVKSLPAKYPQGAEKVLIYNCTGRVVPAGKLPLDVGCIVMNVTSLAFLGKYIETGMPLIEKCVTVDGSACNKPGKVIAPIGTSIKDAIEALGGYKVQPKKILMGGPMMGMAVPTDENPIVKNTNGLLAFDEKDAILPEETECINCGRCVGTCPLSLMPNRIARAYKRRDVEDLKSLDVTTCMECGCCAYVCPAKKDLVQTNKLSKALVMGR